MPWIRKSEVQRKKTDRKLLFGNGTFLLDCRRREIRRQAKHIKRMPLSVLTAGEDMKRWKFLYTTAKAGMTHIKSMRLASDTIKAMQK